jgi:hypothetical protein
MMKLQEFISETFKRIIDGDIETQNYGRTKNVFINVPSGRLDGGPSRRKSDVEPAPQLVEFDIAVVTAGGKDIQGGMGIFVPGTEPGYKVEEESSENEISRVIFSIPVALPSPLVNSRLYVSRNRAVN